MTLMELMRVLNEYRYRITIQDSVRLGEKIIDRFLIDTIKDTDTDYAEKIEKMHNNWNKEIISITWSNSLAAEDIYVRA